MSNEFNDDPEMFFALQERGGHGHGPGHTDPTAGELAIAGQTRIGGHDQLNPLIFHLFDALRAGGWADGDPIVADVGRDTHDEKAARTWAVREAIAYARIMATTKGRPDAEAAMATLYDTGLPDEAVRITHSNERSKDGGGMIIIKLRYLSDGASMNGQNELSQALSQAGITVMASGEPQ